MKVKNFLLNVLFGAIMGFAVIIPGVSGGTLAVILKIYDKLIDAVSGLRKNFKQNFLFLLPIALGIIIGVGAMYFPIKYALEYAPLPTVLLFAGLMLGSFPRLLKEGAECGFKKLNVLSVTLPFAVVIAICFIPGLESVNLGLDMPVWGYFLLVLMGAVASCALVIPGVSGSLVMLIFGYYQPLIAAVSALKDSFGHYFLVLALFGMGIIIGFFSIAKLMKFLLNKFPRGTRWAIIGFVLGSVPAILITFDYASSPINTAQITVGVILAVLGAIASYALTAIVEKKADKSVTNSEDNRN